MQTCATEIFNKGDILGKKPALTRIWSVVLGHLKEDGLKPKVSLINGFDWNLPDISIHLNHKVTMELNSMHGIGNLTNAVYEISQTQTF